MTATEHLLSAPGGELQNVVVCRKCESGRPGPCGAAEGARAAVLPRHFARCASLGGVLAPGSRGG